MSTAYPIAGRQSYEPLATRRELQRVAKALGETQKAVRQVYPLVDPLPTFLHAISGIDKDVAARINQINDRLMAKINALEKTVQELSRKYETLAGKVEYQGAYQKKHMTEVRRSVIGLQGRK